MYLSEGIKYTANFNLYAFLRVGVGVGGGGSVNGKFLSLFCDIPCSMPG